MPDRYRLVIEAAPLGVILIDAGGRIVLANARAGQMFGYIPDELAGKPIEVLVPAASREHHTAMRDHFNQSPATHMIGDGRELHGLHKNGSLIPVEIGLNPVVIDDRRFVIAGVVDLTKRREAESAQRAADERFRQIAESIQEVFWMTDVKTRRLEYVSPGYERVWGRTCESLYANQKDWLTAVHPSDQARVREAMQNPSREIEYRIHRPDGELRWIRDRSFPVRNADGELIRIAGISEDITERRTLERELRQAQRMESIGLLAGGVAHDFNNLLTVIGASAEMLEEECAGREPAHALVTDIQHASQRAAGLTRQLLAFSRRDVIDPRVTSLNAVVADTEKMLRRLIGEDLELTTSADPGAPPVLIDPDQWSQVLINLAVNARDAMPSGGRLSIATRDARITHDESHHHARLRPGHYAMLEITDTGSGMTPEVRARIFDPFFTTKEKGHGTGLGLSVVHGIVQQCHGHVDVESEVGAGTTFRIYLPASAPVDAAPAVASPTVARGHGVILLVEDEAAVRTVAARFLRRAGYTVVTANNGHEAIRMLDELAEPVDLLITDVVMPGAGGRAVADAMHARFPTTPVLYTSGYTEQAVLHHGVRRTEVAFISKPYSSKSLVEKVAELVKG
ncbi:MAG: PAS domain-containing sensor histidine kinase [Acidobacteria bacterium]|nr:MAG: PAS domain-containing sensor histidine kinase [Acidobacteriota bacterium]